MTRQIKNISLNFLFLLLFFSLSPSQFFFNKLPYILEIAREKQNHAFVCLSNKKNSLTVDAVVKWTYFFNYNAIFLQINFSELDNNLHVN